MIAEIVVSKTIVFAVVAAAIVEEMAKYEHEATHKILGAIGHLKLQNLHLAMDAESRQAELKAELRRGFRRLQGRRK